MRLPNFTAEAALHLSSESYGFSASNASKADEQTVVPQLKFSPNHLCAWIPYPCNCFVDPVGYVHCDTCHQFFCSQN